MFMAKSKTYKIIFTGLLILFSIAVDFILHGLFREYPLLVFFILWFLADLKFNLDIVVFMVISFLLLLSEVFLSVYKMDWFVNRVAMWVFLIFLFVVFSETRKLTKKSTD